MEVIYTVHLRLRVMSILKKFLFQMPETFCLDGL
ncbi:hypothetical protein [Salmonella phage vB_SenM-S16]|uniref:Uncharacterized protein n=1 Tax=Salmonella phage S16 TaxID=1087482 RepID=M1HEZ2_BPS16|nr:hypothetical protein I133_gp174 [Salmonella phage vB_SenM-S16]AGE48173.1 hypothetical protein [Salmonella phage vB_SenM-S16]